MANYIAFWVNVSTDAIIEGYQKEKRRGLRAAAARTVKFERPESA
jgi:hypothetical protein